MLEGIRVVEMANVISGPFSGMLLADMGAEVVKVEMPRLGDPFRSWAGTDQAIAPSFAAYNRGKKSVTINAKSEPGREAYRRIVESADVVLDNFRPGTLDRMGIGPEALCAADSTLIYCSLCGLGTVGPDRDRPTYDAIAQGMSGLWSQLTDIEAPEAVGPPMSDQLTGLYAANAILGALVARGRNGGQGQHLEVSMLGASLAFQPHAVAEYLATGAVAGKVSRAHISQSYAFAAVDGLPFTVHLSSQPKFWAALVRAVDRPELESDPRFADKRDRHRHYGALKDELQAVFGMRPRAEWLSVLQEADVPAAPIHTIDRALSDPQVQAIGMVRRFGTGERATDLIGYGYGSSAGVPDPAARPVPQLGEHTDEILTACGFDASERAVMREVGAV